MKWEATPENTNEKCENEPSWGKKKAKEVETRS